MISDYYKIKQPYKQKNKTTLNLKVIFSHCCTDKNVFMCTTLLFRDG